MGEISGHSKFINAIDYRQVRPFRVVTAGEDKHVNFYEGPPFKYVASHTVKICHPFIPDSVLSLVAYNVSSKINFDQVFHCDLF